MLRHIAAALALTLGAITGTAHASIIDQQDVAYDSATRLQWLKLSSTAGLSINQVLSGAGGWINSYRYATSDEVLTMLNHLGFIESDYTTAPVTGGFVATIGGHTAAGYYGTWFRNGDQGASGMSYDISVTAILADGDGPLNARTDACPKYFNCNFTDIALGPRSFNYANPIIGSFLVSTVPEPGTVALLGLGALGLLVMRARKNSSRKA